MTDRTATHAEEAAIGDRPIDVDAERAITPGSTTRHHFNSAGAALQTSQTVDAVVAHLRLEESEGGYEAATRNKPLTEAAYAHAATLLGATPDEIALFDSATTGMRQVLDALRFTTGQKVIVSRSTYVSQALQLLSLRAERAIDLVVLPNSEDGSLDLTALEVQLASSTDAVICVAHIPTSSGLVEPVEAVGALAKQYGALFVLDATQSVGQVVVDVAAIGCDVLVTTGRKFLRAPRGTGLAFVSAALIERIDPWAPDVRASSWTSENDWSSAPIARKLESWEHAVAARVGLATALEQAIGRGMGPTAAYLGALSADLRSRLSGIDGVELADPPAATSAIITFRLPGVPDAEVIAFLKTRDIHTISIPAAHAQWDLGSRGIQSVIRASVHVYNNTADLDALTNAVSEFAGSRKSAPLGV